MEKNLGNNADNILIPILASYQNLIRLEDYQVSSGANSSVVKKTKIGLLVLTHNHNNVNKSKTKILRSY